MNLTEREHLARLRRWLVILSISIVFLGILVPAAVVAFQWEATERSTLSVTCSSARANISQLGALADLERRLGIPVEFEIPPLPEECW